MSFRIKCDHHNRVSVQSEGGIFLTSRIVFLCGSEGGDLNFESCVCHSYNQQLQQLSEQQRAGKVSQLSVSQSLTFRTHHHVFHSHEEKEIQVQSRLRPGGAVLGSLR